jgi:hypothetical protein
LESNIGIYCWNWNLVLESFVEVEFEIQEILKLLFKMSEKKIRKKKEKNNNNKEKKSEVSKRRKKIKKRKF